MTTSEPRRLHPEDNDRPGQPLLSERLPGGTPKSELRSETGCFVYIQLPGSLDVVTCGRFEQSDGLGRFVYGRSYLNNPRAVELEMYELPLARGQRETTRLGGIFGALRDAAPDAWGRRVLERALGRPHLDDVELLLASHGERAGALSFGRTPEPTSRRAEPPASWQLDRLLEEADRIERDDPPLDPEVFDLLEQGSSLGGARPKSVVEDEQGLWVAKLPARGDRWNVAAVEGAMLRLAAECGIRVPESRLVSVGGRDVLLVKRFDRERVEGGYLRHRMVSALTALGADESPLDRTRWSYVLLADELRRRVEDVDGDLEELYRRMVFNALISNTDDHPRNHALIAPGSSWHLSPAYDLPPSPHPSAERDLSMEIGSQGRLANRSNLLSRCARFRLTEDAAAALIDRMKQTVSARWRATCREIGVSERDCDLIASAFDYPGFGYSRG